MSSTPPPPPPPPPPVSLVLAETADASSALAMVKSGRVRFTCVAASARFVALGANTGSVYLFEHGQGTLRHRHLVAATAEAGEVTALMFSHGDSMLAIGTHKGAVTVMELTLDAKDKTKVLSRWTAEHKDHAITQLLWAPVDDRLFSADDTGSVFVTQVGDTIISMFRKPDLVLKADSRVVQMDLMDDKLIVSSLTKVVLVQWAKNIITQVGKKTRQGKFGACFVSGKEFVTSRPGLRLWSADTQGNVLATLNFQSSLADRPASSLLSVLHESMQTAPLDSGSAESAEVPTGKDEASGINFAVLHRIHPRLVLSHNEQALFLIDMAAVDIHTWYDRIRDIRSVSVYANQLFVLCDNSRKLLCLSLQSPARCFELLVENKCWLRAALFALSNRTDVVTCYGALDTLSVNLQDGLLTDAQKDDLNILVEESKQHAPPPPSPSPQQQEPGVPVETETPQPEMESEVAVSELETLQAAPGSESREPVDACIDDGQKQVDRNIIASYGITDDADPGTHMPSEANRSTEPSLMEDGSSFVPTIVDEASFTDAAAAIDVSSAIDVFIDASLSTGGKKKRKKSAPRRLVDIDTGTLVRTGSLTNSSTASPVTMTTASSTPTPKTTTSSSSEPPQQIPPSAGTRTGRIVSRSVSGDSLNVVDGNERKSATPTPQPQQPQPHINQTQTQSQAQAHPNTNNPEPQAVTTDPSSPSPPPPQATVVAPIPLHAHLPGVKPQLAPLASAASKAFDDLKKSTRDNISKFMPTHGSASSSPTPIVVSAATAAQASTNTPTTAATVSTSSMPSPTGSATTVTGATLASGSSANKGTDGALSAAAAQVQHLALLTEQAMSLVALQQNNVNGFHLSTKHALRQWLTFFHDNMWTMKSKDIVASELQKRKTNLKLLLTTCLEVGVVQGVLPSSSARAQAVDEPEDFESNVIAYITEFFEYIDVNRTADYCNSNGFRQALKALWLCEDERTARSDEMRLNVQKHIANGDSSRVFSALNNNPRNHISLILRVLPRLLALDRQAMIDLAIRIQNTIQPQHMRTALGIEGTAPPTLPPMSIAWITYTEYLNQLIASGSQLVVRDSSLLVTCAHLNLLAAVQARQKGSADDHSDAQWPNAAWLRELVCIAPKDSIEQLLVLFQQYMFIPGSFELLLRLGRRSDSVRLALDLDDPDLLASALIECRDEAVWSLVLESMTEKLRRAHGDPQRPASRLDKSFVVQELTVWLGPEKALKLLHQHRAFCDLLDTNLYETFLRAAEREHMQNKVVHKLLETVDSYLWLRRPQTMPAQMRYLRDLELSETRPQAPYLTGSAQGCQQTELAFEYSLLQWPVYYEESSEHWGAWLRTTANQANCAVCTLALSETSGSITIFPCTHGFHSTCIPEDACPICLHDRVGLLRDRADPRTSPNVHKDHILAASAITDAASLLHTLIASA